MRNRFLLGICLPLVTCAMILACQNSTAEPSPHCSKHPFALQVLGSGGPEIEDQRASTSYLLWMDGRARLMIDTGSGSSLRFEQSKANFADLQAILFTHMHSDHVSELETYIKGGYFLNRKQDLYLFGPHGNVTAPSIHQWIDTLFYSPNAAYRYLSEYFDTDSNADYKVQVTNVDDLKTSQWKHTLQNGQITLEAVYVDHGPFPTIAWKVIYDGKSIAFTGDTAARAPALRLLLKNSDTIVAHHAVPENTNRIARNLHMPPSVIGELAAQANTKQLILSHRMLRTIGKEQESLALIREHYLRSVEFADDLNCYPITTE